MKERVPRISLYIHAVISIIFMSVAQPGYGEIKVVERSLKKLPGWILQKPEDCLLVIGRGPTLQDAQRDAEQELLRQVISGVAVNVRSEATSESVKEGDKEWESFLSRVSARSADLPFLSGITLAKCSDTYWEKVLDKTTGKESFRIYFLYPFDSSVRGKLIDEYMAYDRSMEDKLEELERKYESTATLEGLAIAESELETLSEWFPDAQRANRSEKVLGLYKQIRKSLQLVGEMVCPGECKVKVMRGNSPFSVPGRLEVSSNCASRIKVIAEDKGWRVTFNTDDCLAWEENTLKFALRGAGLNLKGSISF